MSFEQNGKKNIENDKNITNLTNFKNFTQVTNLGNPLKRLSEDLNEEKFKDFKRLSLVFEDQSNFNYKYEKNRKLSSSNISGNENSRSSFKESFDKYCENSNSFPIDLNGYYDQFMNSKKTANFENFKIKAEEKLKENDYFDKLNYSVKSEIIIFSKYSLEWIQKALDFKYLNLNIVNEKSNEIFNKIHLNLKCYKYETSNYNIENLNEINNKTDFNKNYEILETLQSIYNLFLNDFQKNFYFFSKNFAAYFFHFYDDKFKTFQSVVYISAKNKNVIKILEKEDIKLQILHKHEQLEGISTPQKFIKMENTRNNIFGMELSPGIELLKITKKNIQSFINFLLNSYEKIDNNFQLLSNYPFNNGTPFLPKIRYQGEISISDSDIPYEILNKNVKVSEENKEFFQLSFKANAHQKSFFENQSQIKKCFKLVLNGYIFNYQIREIENILKEIGIPHKIDTKNIELTKFFKNDYVSDLVKT